MAAEGIGSRVQDEYGDLTHRIIGAAMAVHTTLGPGFPEQVYQKALAIALSRRGIGYQQEYPVCMSYEGIELGDFYLDLMVENRVVVELKAVEQLSSVHQHQVISYLTATGREVALLFNFGAGSLEHKRILPPRSVQLSKAYQLRLGAWRSAPTQSPESAESADE